MEAIMLEEKLLRVLQNKYNKNISECSNYEIYQGLLLVTKQEILGIKKNTGNKKLYYISAEFLIGKLLSNHLINLGLFEETRNTLKKYGKDLTEIEEMEIEPSLGNGGLGRLAACFLDSIATLGLNGDGIGLNYHFGLFKQEFKNYKQMEYINPWITEDGWLRKTDVGFQIPFQKFTLQSRMYDIDITGYESGRNKLHLFDLESIDESLVHDGINFNKEDIPHNLTLFLYPDDSDKAGNLLRIYQQYFMVCNAVQYIIKECKEKGFSLREISKHVVVQINDTHPTMIIPEFIRQLLLNGISMEEAIQQVVGTCAYTNHTILAEALEKWPVAYLNEVHPS